MELEPVGSATSLMVATNLKHRTRCASNKRKDLEECRALFAASVAGAHGVMTKPTRSSKGGLCQRRHQWKRCMVFMLANLTSRQCAGAHSHRWKGVLVRKHCPQTFHRLERVPDVQPSDLLCPMGWTSKVVQGAWRPLCRAADGEPHLQLDCLRMLGQRASTRPAWS